VEEEYGE